MPPIDPALYTPTPLAPASPTVAPAGYRNGLINVRPMTPLPLSAIQSYNPNVALNRESDAARKVNESDVASFNDWYGKLTPEQKAAFAPKDGTGSIRGSAGGVTSTLTSDNTEGITRENAKQHFMTRLRAPQAATPPTAPAAAPAGSAVAPPLPGPLPQIGPTSEGPPLRAPALPTSPATADELAAYRPQHEQLQQGADLAREARSSMTPLPVLQEQKAMAAAQQSLYPQTQAQLAQAAAQTKLVESQTAVNMAKAQGYISPDEVKKGNEKYESQIAQLNQKHSDELTKAQQEHAANLAKLEARIGELEGRLSQKAPGNTEMTPAQLATAQNNADRTNLDRVEKINRALSDYYKNNPGVPYNAEVERKIIEGFAPPAHTSPTAARTNPSAATQPATSATNPQTGLPLGNGAPLQDAAIASAFMQAAGGDKNKARELATQHGWKLQ